MKSRENLIWLGALLVVIALTTPASIPAEAPPVQQATYNRKVYYPTGPLRSGICALDEEALDALEKSYEREDFVGSVGSTVLTTVGPVKR